MSVQISTLYGFAVCDRRMQGEIGPGRIIEYRDAVPSINWMSVAANDKWRCAYCSARHLKAVRKCTQCGAPEK